MENRQARLDRWAEGSRAQIGTVEPEWWLRMMCGQLAHEDSAAQTAGMRRVLRRFRNQFTLRFRGRSKASARNRRRIP